MSISQENIDISVFQTRLKYELITNCLDSIESITPNDKFLLVYDISYPLSILKRLSSIESDSDLDNDTVIRISYSILNSLAHYRHYFTTKMHCSTVIIAYSSDESIYNDFEKVTKLIRKILNLFKKTIFIEKLDENIKFIYQHICYFTCMNVFISNGISKRKCRIVYIGNNQLFLQMLRIDREMIHIKHNSIDHGINLFNNYLYNDSNEKDLEIMFNSDLIAIILSVFGFKNGYPKLDSIKHKKVANIYKQIITNCKESESIDKDNCKYLFNNIKINDKEFELIILRLKSLDVDFQNKLFTLSKSLLKIWTSKLHTTSVQSINDYIRSDVELNYEWLGFN